MKLKNIAMKDGKNINLSMVLNNKKILIVPNKDFEIEDSKARELLKLKIDDKPIVEVIKESKKDKED